MESERNKPGNLEDKFRIIPFKVPQREPKQWYEHPVLMKVYDFLANGAASFYFPVTIGSIEVL